MSKIILLLVFSLLCQGCGILLFPVSIPLAVMHNRTLQIHATVTDSNGKPLPQAQAALRTSVTFPSLHVTGMEAIYLLTDDHDFESTREIVNGQLDLVRWGDSLCVYIKAPGYYARILEVTEKGVEELLPRDGRSDHGIEIGWDWTYVPISRLALDSFALEPIGAPTKLAEYSYLKLAEATSGRLTYFSLDDPPKQRELDPRTQTMPKNCLWMTAARDADGEFAQAGGTTRDPRIRALTLHSTCANGGFIGIPLENGRPVGGRIRNAPATGYQADWVFPQEGLSSESQRVFFYFKSDRLYGVGLIEYLWFWRKGAHMTADNDGGVKVELHLWLQPDGTTNVE
jgi:hypothetical protein